jgi:hypothetical protein
MDVRARAATFLKRFLVSFSLCIAGFAPRQFNRSVASLLYAFDYMANLISEIISILESNNSAHVQEALLQASFIFEKFRGVGANLTPERQMESLGWTFEIIHEDFSESNVADLKWALIAYIERIPKSDYAGSALFALACLMDVSTKAVFINALKNYLNGDAASLYQAMIGLDNIGERIFYGRSSNGITNIEVNRQLAKRYLEEQGLT